MSADADFWRPLVSILGALVVVRWVSRGRAWKRERQTGDSSQWAERDESTQEALSRLDARVAELENRLDFAERLLAPGGGPTQAPTR
jgi:hypothetical protein